MNCDACGKELEIGEWPFCPHGFGSNLYEPHEAYVDWNLTSKPVLISNPGDRQQHMRRNRLDYYSRGVGMPGCEV